MSDNCFKLRHFNLPARFDDVLRHLADAKGEICGGVEVGDYLPYSGPFANLDVDDYLRLQSNFLGKGLIREFHSPDEVRFAKEGIADYITDPQKRQMFVEQLDAAQSDEEPITVDNAKCLWKRIFTFPKLHSDDALIQAYWSHAINYGEQCRSSHQDIWNSFAQHYGLMGEQRSAFEKAFTPANLVIDDSRRWFLGDYMTLDALVGDVGLTLAGAIRFVHQYPPAEWFTTNIRDFVSLISLSKYGVSDEALSNFAKSMSSREDFYFDSSYLEPLYLELQQLGDADPVGTIKKIWGLEAFFKVLVTMRDNGYTDDEMRWVVGHYPLIDNRYFGVNSAEIFSRARREKVSFQEIRWMLEDATGFPTRMTIDDVFRAYCHHPKRTRETVYKLFSDENLCRAYSLEPSDAETLGGSVSIINEQVRDAFANRLGIQPEQSSAFLLSSSSVLWEFVLKNRAEAFIFDPQKIEDYKAIAKDVHNRGTGSSDFFLQFTFEYYTLQSPPRSILEAARVFKMLENVDYKLSKKYFEEVVCHIWSHLRKDYQAWYNPKTGRLDVTRHNIKDVNGILALFERPTLDFSEEGEWFTSHLDVEEIDVRNFSIDTLAEYHELTKRLRNAGAAAASSYLSSQLLNLNTKKVFGAIGMMDIAKIEAVRGKSNESYPHLGDQLVDNLGIAMLENIEPTVSKIAELQRVARTWSLNGNDDVWRDNRGLYQQYSYFAYQMISDVVLDKTGNWHDEDRIENLRSFLAGQGVELDTLVDELEGEGFPIRTESDWDKFTNRITTDPGYVFRRGVQKIVPIVFQAPNLSGLTATPDTDWVSRAGVSVLVVRNADDKEIARAIRCDRNVIGAEILLNAHALVNTEMRKQELGARYVFSAPLNMTTPDQRTMTEIAYDRGDPMNWLMTARGKDGLLLVGTDQAPHILDKRGIKLSEMINPADMPALKDDLAIWKKRRKLEALSDSAVLNVVIRPFNRFADKLLFRVIMEHKSYSLLNGMLFTAHETTHRLEKELGTASRRLFVEYADGRFGVVDGSENLTTEGAFEAAKAAGATKAIYMDTGFWDQADYVDGKGESHRLDPGHSNSSESTNRVIIRVK